MRIIKMYKKFLEPFLECLGQFGRLYAPVRKNGVLTYGPIESISEAVFSDEHPLIPIKKLFHPMKFDMFRFGESGFQPDYSMVEKRVIIGVHPCEIHSLLRLDDVFMADPPDPYYSQLRHNSAILGFSCMPTENSLCTSTGTDIVEEGYDLFFIDLDQFYLVWVGSSLGHDMILCHDEFFEDEVTHEDIAKYVAWREKRNLAFKKSFAFRNMPDLMELSYNSEIWEQFGKKCLSCGQCSMVCPTCNCYDTTDVLDVSNKVSGRRERMWDSCMFVDYSLVAGGHNFRATRADRLKLWYTHKLKTFGKEYGRPSCVGCGRCVDTCPVDINVLTVSQALSAREVPK
ncbi:MAG: 4Fe-4S dicluster domain-containing protein [Candidatus Thorarchaeota archaeon]|nr:4Fe-4S dicluster domain-containing protein [Candidatus Thorarchaeota archaeon]